MDNRLSRNIIYSVNKFIDLNQVTSGSAGVGCTFLNLSSYDISSRPEMLFIAFMPPVVKRSMSLSSLPNVKLHPRNRQLSTKTENRESASLLLPKVTKLAFQHL